MFGTKKTSMQLLTECLRIYESKAYKKAEKLCRQILRGDSTEAPVWILLGNILFMQNRFDEALNAYQIANDLRPDYYEAKINLANTYTELADYPKAEVYARESLCLDSQSMQAYGILGQACLELEKNTEAIIALENAQKLDSHNPWIYNYLSQAYQKKGLFSQALAAGWQAVELSGNADEQAVGFGYLLYEIALEDTSDSLRRYADLWLEKFPHSKITFHMANALKNTGTVCKADSEYVKNIFDAFASDFDEVLTSLNYQTPAHIARILENFYPSDSKPKLRILDAGCGTGLCGKFLKNYAGFASLHGVDISSEMLKIAARKKLYSRLYCEDLDSFLRLKKEIYDLIVSADVFTYFGTLDSLIPAVSSALKKGGRIIFSISENKLNNQDYFLHFSGRFLHKLSYVKSVLETNALQVEKTEYSMLREEGGRPVFGYIVSSVKV